MKNSLKLRRWNLQDVKFVLKVRNNPRLMCWFRQDEPLTEYEQYGFIEYDLLYNKYFGCIIELNNKPIGITNLKNTMEFGLALLPQYQNKGLEEKILNWLPKGSWSHVFLGNPMIKIYWNNGFIISKTNIVYYKKRKGNVKAVIVEKIGEGLYEQYSSKGNTLQTL